MTGHRRACRLSSALAATILVAGLVLAYGAPPASAADEVGGERSELDGTGTDSAKALMNSTASAVYDSPTGVDLTYVPLGDRDGREAFTEGKLDFVVSGRPMSDSDHERMQGTDVISAPISVGAAVFLVHISYQNGYKTYTLDPNDPESVTFGEYAGPLRIPNDVLARTLLEKVNNLWAEPGLMQALGLGSSWQFVAAGPAIPFVQSLPGSSNWYVGNFVQRFAPTQWQEKAAEVLLPDAGVGEAWPFLTTPSRPSSSDLSGIVASGLGPQGSGGQFPPGGTVAPVAPSDAKEWLDKGNASLVAVQVQNAAGEWVAPTPAAISKAAEAGLSDSAVLDEPISGVYPVVWINRMYVKASGLDANTANALATLVRYGATTGQDALADLGEGRLPDSLTDEALEAADEIVKGNCSGNGAELVSLEDDGGPYWPKSADASGEFKLCRVPQTSATVETAAESFGAADFSYDIPSTALPALLGASAVSAAAEAEKSDPDLSPVSLLMPAPADGRGNLDRLGAIMLGACVYLLALPVLKGIRRRQTGGSR